MEATIEERLHALELRQAGQNVRDMARESEIRLLRARVAVLEDRLTPSELAEFDALKQGGSFRIYGGVKEPRRNLSTLRALRRIGGAIASLPSERPW